MTYGEIVVNEVYVYRAKEGSGYSRYEGKEVLCTRKCGKNIKRVEIRFLDGPRKGQTRILLHTELQKVRK